MFYVGSPQDPLSNWISFIFQKDKKKNRKENGFTEGHIEDHKQAGIRA